MHILRNGEFWKNVVGMGQRFCLARDFYIYFVASRIEFLTYKKPAGRMACGFCKCFSFNAWRSCTCMVMLFFDYLWLVCVFCFTTQPQSAYCFLERFNRSIINSSAHAGGFRLPASQSCHVLYGIGGWNNSPALVWESPIFLRASFSFSENSIIRLSALLPSY